MGKRTITIWKLGSLEHKMIPKPEAIAKLAKLLATKPDHVVWGPDIQVQVVEIDDDEHVVVNATEEDQNPEG